MAEDSSGTKSAIPDLRVMRESDQPLLEKLYDKMCPGQRTNLSPNANTLAAVVERQGRISAAAIGGYATVAQILLLADPEISGSTEAEHDALAALDAVMAAVRNNAAPGAVVGQIVIVADRLRSLGQALDRMGWMSAGDRFTAHITLFSNVQDDGPPPPTV